MTTIDHAAPAPRVGGGTVHTAQVLDRTEVADGVVELVLEPEAPVAGVLPGSHVDVLVPLPGGTVKRSYSLVDTGRHDGLLRIAVRRADPGRGGSRWLHDVEPGTRLDLLGPLDDFAPSPGALPSVLVAAGIGVTPIVGLAAALRAGGADYRVVYSGRTRAQMAYVDHLEREHPGRVDVIETAGAGRLDVAGLVAAVPAGGVLYVCGPMGLLSAIRAEWEKAGRAAWALRFETFGTSGSVAAQTFRVRVPAHGVEVDVPVGSTMLDALEGAGLELMYGCRRGECGLCRVRVLDADGALDHRDAFLSARQRTEGHEMCSCVSRVAGGTVTIDC